MQIIFITFIILPRAARLFENRDVGLRHHRKQKQGQSAFDVLLRAYRDAGFLFLIRNNTTN